ncbi:MAG: aldehyde dehydrogenase family protein, partial [Spirochaetes bacterium]|nr:aldehyde dehydrogenase family protein [Spirochaetota bacterium]
MQEYKLFINGEWISSGSGETFDNINPATLEPIGKFHKATKDDVKSAVDSAEDAYDSWSSTPAPQRA